MSEFDYVLTIPLLSVDECNDLVNKAIQWEEGKVDSVFSALSEQSNKIRKVQFCKEAVDKKLQDRIFDCISSVNSEYYNYNLQGFNKKDPPSVLKYTGERGDHYTWHVDTPLIETSSLFSRKLSFTLQLTNPNDYEGGSLEFEPDIKCSDMRLQGCITIFPSKLLHRVTEMTMGTRYTVVGWIWGDSDLFKPK